MSWYEATELTCSFCGETKLKEDIAVHWVSFGLLPDHVECGNCLWAYQKEHAAAQRIQNDIDYSEQWQRRLKGWSK